MEKHHIDKRIFEELNELEANPPVEAWLNISDALDQRRKKKRMPALLGIAASVTVLMAFALSLWFSPPDTPVDEIALQPSPDAEHLTSLEARLPVGQNHPDILPVDPVQHQPAHISQRSVSPAGMDAGPPMAPVHASLQRDHHPPAINDLRYHSDMTPALLALQQPDKTFSSRDEILTGNPQGKLSLGLHVTPQQNHRLLAENTDFATSTIPFESLEDGILTYGAGISLSYMISGSITIQTGLNYIHTGQYVNDIYAYKHPGDIPLFDADRNSGLMIHPQTVLTSQGAIRFHDPYHYFADVQSHRVITNKQSVEINDIQSLRQTNTGLTQVFRFVELPVNFRYQLVSRYVGLQVKGGFSVNYLLNNDVYAGQNIYQHSIGETHGVRTVNFAAMGGFSLDIPLAGNLMLHLEPTAQIFLNPILQEGMMMGHAYPYSYSLQTGISYRFLTP